MRQTKKNTQEAVQAPVLTRHLSCQEQLDFAREQFGKLVDAGALSIEKEVFDLAIVLGFYGAMPAAACSGHERSDEDPTLVEFPWVRFEPAKINKSAQKKLEKALDKIEALGDDIFAAEHTLLRQKWRQHYLHAREPNLKLCRYLYQLLDDFYRIHHAPSYEVQLTIQDIDLDGSVLQSMGQEVFGAMSRREQLRMLKLCREELREFGNFLQERFLASDAGRQQLNKYVVKGHFEA